MKAEDIQTLIRIFKENTIYLNGRAITLNELGYDAYGVCRIQLETERNEVILSLPDDEKQETQHGRD